ncbi:MAG: ATP-binding protein [Chloroflexi bacterium]|nr:ATP-binding protein [Chloroflexota bacterium]
MPQNIEANVGGNFSGNLVAGNYNIVVNNLNGGVVNVAPPPAKPSAEPRTRPVNLRPRDFHGLLDRAPEMEAFAAAVQSSTPFAVFGENGIGKTSLLRKAAHLAGTKNFHDGVVYLAARETARDDLLQDIYDSFFAAGAEYKPTDGELRAKLKDIHGLVLLDDLTLNREEVSFILDTMPHSMFILASAERVLWGEGQAVSLDGLPEAEAVQLFERELGRPLAEDERPVALQICKMLLTHPFRILQTASMLREDGLSLPQALQRLTATRTQSPTVEMAIQNSTDTQKKVFSLLAAAGGFALTRDHVLAMIPAANFNDEVKSLIRRGFVLEEGSSLSLSSDAASSLARLWNLTDWEDALVGHFTNWLKTGPQDMLVDQASDLLFHLLKRTGEKKQWPQLVTLGRTLERISILQKKWQRWMQILDLLKMAARALMDKKLEGWALHQLGVRSMGLGMKMEAQEFFEQALDMRRAIGDKGGIQVTQHNLNVLASPPVPPKVGKPSPAGSSNFVRWLLMGSVGGGMLALAALALVFLAIINSGNNPTPVPPPPPTLTHFPTLPPAETFTPFVPAAQPTRTPTSTPTPALVVVFDFVEQANGALWETRFDPISERPPEALKFLTDVPSPSPEEFASSNETAYAGWQPFPLMEDASKGDDLALLTYPFFNAGWVRGTYDLTPFRLQPGDVFKARIGYKLLPGEFKLNTRYVTFAVYFYEPSTPDPRMIGEFVEFYDGAVSEWEFPIPEDLAGRQGFFVLEVHSGNDLPAEWLVWLDAQLIGLPR